MQTMHVHTPVRQHVVPLVTLSPHTLHVQGGFQAGSFTPLYGSPQKAVYQPSPANSTTYRHVPGMRQLLAA